MQVRLHREYERLEFIRGQVRELEAQRRLLLKESESTDLDQIRALSCLKGIGEERFARGGPRARKVGIVALARKLLVELWRYLEWGVLPEGAELTPHD